MASAAGSSSIEISASPERILAVVIDIAAYPKWAEGVQEARTIETDANGRPTRASFVVDAKIKKVRYDLLYTYLPNGVSWENVPGQDVDEIKGSYLLKPLNGKTHVEYNYSIDPGFPMPGPLRRQAVKVIVSIALKGLKKRVEQATGQS